MGLDSIHNVFSTNIKCLRHSSLATTLATIIQADKNIFFALLAVGRRSGNTRENTLEQLSV
jgi:hypothetical protein